MSRTSPGPTSETGVAVRTVAVRLLCVGLIALPSAAALFFSPAVSDETWLQFAFGLFVIAGLSALVAFVLGLCCWRAGAVGVTVGALALLLAWGTITVLGVLALRDFRFGF